MRILFTSYPLLPVSDTSAGGAEQMLWTLERELHRRGHETAVAACNGSSVSGHLIDTGAPAVVADRLREREAEHNARTLAAIREARQQGESFDQIHDESGLFWRSGARDIREPVLATLHLPLDFYVEQPFEQVPPNVSFNFVSQSQRELFSQRLPQLRDWPVIHNGIAVERLPFQQSKGDYLLWLGRICEEKGTHVAIDIAERAGMPLIIAGQVYPFAYHRQYFEQQVAPRLSARIQFIERPDFERKCELLANARALLVPTLIDETSSLTAMEAMACGTAVIAFRRGALPEVVSHGETGFVVDSEEEMLAAMAKINNILPYACRRRAEQHFSAVRMAGEYENLYRTILTQRRTIAA